MQIKHTHTCMRSLTHTHTRARSNETKPIETDIATTKKLLRFLRRAYYYFIRKQTHRTETQTPRTHTHTHTHACAYGNAAAAAADDSVPTPAITATALPAPPPRAAEESVRATKIHSRCAARSRLRGATQRPLSLSLSHALCVLIACASLPPSLLSVVSPTAVPIVCIFKIHQHQYQHQCKCLSVRTTAAATSTATQRRQRRSFVCIFLLSVV